MKILLPFISHLKTLIIFLFIFSGTTKSPASMCEAQVNNLILVVLILNNTMAIMIVQCVLSSPNQTASRMFYTEAILKISLAPGHNSFSVAGILHSMPVDHVFIGSMASFTGKITPHNTNTRYQGKACPGIKAIFTIAPV